MSTRVLAVLALIGCFASSAFAAAASFTPAHQNRVNPVAVPVGPAQASSLATTWARTIGGREDDKAKAVIATNDGGYVIAGSTSSFGAGAQDAWVLEVDATGSVLWQKTYGGPDTDNANSIAPTDDGSYVVAGTLSGQPGIWKLDALGELQWQKTVQGLDVAGTALSIAVTGDGGAIVLCSDASDDLLVIKLGKNGDIVWQKSYLWQDGQRVGEYGPTYAVRATSDGNYVISLRTFPTTRLLKIDPDGDVLWARSYGGLLDSGSIAPTNDGGLVLGGYLDVAQPAPEYDLQVFWVARLDASGNVLWQKMFTGDSRRGDFVQAVTATRDGGIIVAGVTNYFGSLYTSSGRTWVLRLSGQGDVMWQKTLDGSYYDGRLAITTASDGSTVLAGSTIAYGAGDSDIWLVKLDGSGNINAACPISHDTSGAVSNTETVTLELATESVDTTGTLSDAAVTAIIPAIRQSTLCAP